MAAGGRMLSIVLSLAVLLIPSAQAFAADPPPQPEGLRMRGVSFVGTDIGLAVGEGILATDNGGESWYRQFTPVEDFTAVDMVTSSVAYAVGDRGSIVRTANGGMSWGTCTSGTTSYLKDVDFVDASYGWAVGDALTVLRTTNGGVTWTPCTPPSPSWPTRPILGVSFVDRLHGWICGSSLIGGDGFSDLYVAKTSDGGLTWTRCSNGVYQPGGGDDTWDFTGIDFVSTTTGWVTGPMPGTQRTTTGGSSWTDHSNTWLTEVDFLDTLRGVGTAKWDGIAAYTTDGGSTWNPGDLILTAPDPSDSLFPGEVCMSSATEAWTVAESYDSLTVEPRGLLAHSENGGENWETQEASTGPVFFLGGATRYDTAANLAKITDAPAGTVVLATGLDYPDALSASGLAGVLDATLLLTGASLPSTVRDTIADMGATDVVIVGGRSAVPDVVEDALSDDYDVERIAGLDRYDTAARIARRMIAEGASADQVFIASGATFADAASAASLSYGRDIPILLVRPDGFPTATRDFFNDLDVANAYILGGADAVSDGVRYAVDSAVSADAERVAAGTDRYDTSALLAEWAEGEGWLDVGCVGIATGLNFPDALTGGALMGSMGRTLLLTDPVSLSSETEEFISSRDVTDIWIMNDRGVYAVTDPVATRLAYLLR